MKDKLYLVEHVIDEHLQIVALKEDWHVAHDLMLEKQGIITELTVGAYYPDGIGTCNHWHYDKDGPEQNGSEEVAEMIL